VNEPGTDSVLRVEDLKVHFPVKVSLLESVGSVLHALASIARGNRGGTESTHRVVHAVDGISFAIRRGEILGLVGESGCGKTTTGRAVLRLAKPTGGRIFFEGRNIAEMKERELRGLRPRMQIVFQDPHAALNPTMTIGQSIQDPLLIRGGVTEAEAKEKTMHVMEEVGLTPATDLFDKFPADLSGGQKQRAVIGRAIILEPALVVADEPVAMLDMSVRARILELLLNLREKYGITFLLITHDLATAKFMCDRIAIMYLGRIVEIGPAEAIYRDPKHPYTKALITAIPIPEPGRQRRITLPRGEVPDAVSPPAGCRFHPRCPVALPTCGWEGRDFISHLEERRLDPTRAQADEGQLGLPEMWRSSGRTAERRQPSHDLFLIFVASWLVIAGISAVLYAAHLHSLGTYGFPFVGAGLSVPLASMGLALSLVSSLVALNLVWLRSWTEGWGVRVAVVDLLFSGYVALIPVTDAFRGVVALHLLIDGFAVYWLTRPFARLALLRRRRFSATREAAERTRRRLNDVVANAPLPMAQAIEDLHVDADTVTVRFRSPDPLKLKDVGDRQVECLLY